MIEIDWKPKEKVLRQFGWICLPGFGLVGTMVAWRLGCFEGSGRWTASYIIWGFAVLCLLVGLIAPRALKWLYVGMTVVAFPIGLVLGFVILGLIFLLLFTPVALFFKLKGRDELQRGWPPPEGESYWIAMRKIDDPKRYFRQF
jgi:hypothetical protein